MVRAGHREGRTHRLFMFLKTDAVQQKTTDNDTPGCKDSPLIALKVGGTPSSTSTTLKCCSCSNARYLKLCQWHLGHAELTAGLSVFTFPAQMVGDLFPHHSLFTFTQRTGNFKEGTRVQVVLRGRDTRVRSGAWGAAAGQEHVLTGIC